MPARLVPSWWTSVLMACLLALLTACTPGADDGAGPREWRDLELVVPDGWTVLEQRADLLHFANEDIRVADGDDAEQPSRPADPDSSDVVAVQLTTDPGTRPGAWRDLVEQQGGVIEQDERIEVGGLPATSLEYRWQSNGVPSRERVVFVPSRDLVVLLQPVPLRDQTTGPEVYLRHTDEFEAVIDSITFGRPVDA